MVIQNKIFYLYGTDRVVYDLTGIKFGRLLVIERTDKKDKWGNLLWDCRCDCGGSRLTNTGNLRHGGVISCGCLVGNKKHGDWNKRIRRIWVAMMSRCYKEIDPQYNNYGGRGILVCQEWRNYFTFKEWAYSNGYLDTLPIDRYPDKNGSYTPDNCRWATSKQQNNNRRSNTIVNIDGVEKTISEWSSVSGVNQQTIAGRLRLGWEIKRAVYEVAYTNHGANGYKNVNRKY